jgi:hypothetical protein
MNEWGIERKFLISSFMKSSNRHFLFFILLISAFSPLRAQQSTPFGVGLHAGVSHSGWNLSIVGQYRVNNFDFYLGPSISLNRGLPGNGPIGLNLGSDYFIASPKPWLASLINVDYQLHFFPSSGNQDVIQEFHLSYGFRLEASNGLFLIQQLGVGMYLESSYIETQSARSTVSGYNGLVRLRAGYNF